MVKNENLLFFLIVRFLVNRELKENIWIYRRHFQLSPHHSMAQKRGKCKGCKVVYESRNSERGVKGLNQLSKMSFFTLSGNLNHVN